MALLVIAVFASAPIDLYGQFLLATFTIATLLVLGWVEPAGGPLRVFVILLTVFTSTRYILWRATETLPVGEPVPFLFGILLFGAEFYCYVILLLSTFLSVDVYNRAPRPSPVSADKCPTVDILIPTYNEDEALLEVTIRAACDVSYPKRRLNVYLLDDGGTLQKRSDKDPEKAKLAQQRHESLKALCDRLGVHYRTREKNEHAKAGNINASLPETHGDLILILDADHVPSADILTRTVGYFVDDPKLFLVQTPHFFLNPDPLERNLETFEEMPSENEMFYSIIQKGLDGYNASFFCGSAAILRRSCVMEIGGIQGDTITEDAETALELHARGYRSAYVAQPMVAGLAPETFTGFIVQRMRWAQGMVQIFLLKNPLLKPGLTIAQRIGYLNSCFYWFFPLARLAFIIGPLLFLLFGLPVYVAGVQEFLVYGAPHILGALMLSTTLYGRTRWAVASELYEVIQSVHCAGAIFEVFRDPRAPSFAVTPKGESLERNYVSPLATPFYWLIGLVCLGQLAGIARLILDPDHAGITSVLLIWNTFHFVLLLGALGALYERSQRRAFPRILRDGSVTLAGKAGPLSVQVNDVSITGLGATQIDGADCKVGDAVTVDAKSLGGAASFALNLEVQSVVEANGTTHIGLRFRLDTHEQWRAVVSLIYSESQNWRTFQDARKSRRSFFDKMRVLMGASLIHSARHLRAILTTKREKSA